MSIATYNALSSKKPKCQTIPAIMFRIACTCIARRDETERKLIQTVAEEESEKYSDSASESIWILVCGNLCGVDDCGSSVDQMCIQCTFIQVRDAVQMTQKI